MKTYKHLEEIVCYKDEIFTIHPCYKDYMISNYGTLIHNTKVYRISPFTAWNQYCRATLKDSNGVERKIDVHRHILEAFCPVPGMELLHADHINGNRIMNIYDPYSEKGNLRWLTPSQNTKHIYFLMEFKKYCDPDYLRPIYYYLKSCRYTVKEVIDLMNFKYSPMLDNLLHQFADQIYEAKEYNL